MRLFALLWLGVSIGIFLLTFIFSFRKHRNLKAALKGLLLGIVLTDIIMLSSLFYYGNTYTKAGAVSDYNSVTNKSADKPFILLYGSEYEITTKNKVAFSIFYALMNAPKMGAFGLKYSIVFAGAFDFPWNLGIPYGVFIIILSIITPIIFGGFLISYVKALWNFLSFHIRRRFKDVYYFSDLTEKSMLLAEDIAKNEKHKALIVFCNCNKVAGSFEDRIDQNHFIVLSENEMDLIMRFSFGQKKQYFFEISDDDNKNLDLTNKLINQLLTVFDKPRKKSEKKKKDKKSDFDNLKVYLFMNSSLFGSENLFTTDQDKINIILVDKIKTSVNNLLFKKPLCYEIDEKQKLLSIAVFGNTAYAKEFFKDSIWASVLDENYKTDIYYVDSKADSFKKNLELNCPGLFSQGKNDQLHFCQTDLQSSELQKKLETEIQHPNYIVIDTGNDEDNINLAIYLRMFYIRNSADFNFKPFIAVKIKDSKTAERVRNMKVKKNMSYDFYSFGSDKEIYSNELIVESPVEKLAQNCYIAYDKAYKKVHNILDAYKDKKAAIFGCNISEFEKCSNRAAAVHIKNKLYLMGLKLVSPDEMQPQDEEIDSEKAENIINEYLKDGARILNLQKYEHKRWSLFYYSEGWEGPTMDDILVYRKLLGPDENKIHKYVLARLHGCLCSWDELDDFEKEYDEVKIYDEVFIRDLPSILGIKKENPLNKAKTEFRFIKR